MLGHLINHPKTLEKSSSFFVIHETAMAPEPAFSPDQLTWIIYKYGELKCVIKVMRAFRIKFCPNNRKDMPSRMSFYRAVKRFESSGGNAKPKERSGKGIPEDHVKQVEEYFRRHHDAACLSHPAINY